MEPGRSQQVPQERRERGTGMGRALRCLLAPLFVSVLLKGRRAQLRVNGKDCVSDSVAVIFVLALKK